MRKPVPWTRQPPYPVGIDWSNPITKALLVASNGSGIVYDKNIARQYAASLSGCKSRSSVKGQVVGFGATYGTGAGDILTLKTPHTVTKDRTVFALIYLNGTGGGALGRIVHYGAAAAPYELFYCGTGQKIVYNRHVSGDQYDVTTTSITIPTGRWVSVAATSTDVNVASKIGQLYQDGVLVASGTGKPYTGSDCGTVTYNEGYIGNRSALDRNFDGMIGPVFIFQRALSAFEIRKLSENPWQVFTPLERRRGSVGNPPQLLSPTGPATSTGWLSSTGGDLYTCVDEATADGADYVYTTTPGSVVEWTFPSGGAVSANGGFVRYQIPAGTGSVSVELRQGASLVQTLGTHTLTGSVQNIEVAITASTTDSVDLRVRFTGNA